jgi:membrane-associated protein
MLGYWLGKKSGPSLFHQNESFFFKKKYLQQAKEFYNEHGPITMITARFLPILRTFSPIVCGIVHMEKKKFVWYSIVGGIAWASLMLFAGHYLYLIFLNYFKFNIKTHLDYILIVIVLITTVPVFYKIFFRKER